MRNSFLSLIVATLFLVVLSGTARAEIFTAYLTGAQEVPPVATTATGYARINVNESTGQLTFLVVFNGLSSAQNNAHIHAPAAIGATVGVAINFGVVGGTSGTISGTASITPTQLSQLRQHLGYVNVHSANFVNGEIRGQLGVQRPVDYDGDGRTDRDLLAALRGQWMYFYTDVKGDGNGLAGVNINSGETAREIQLRDLDERFVTDEPLGLMFVSGGNRMLAYPLTSRR